MLTMTREVFQSTYCTSITPILMKCFFTFSTMIWVLFAMSTSIWVLTKSTNIWVFAIFSICSNLILILNILGCLWLGHSPDWSHGPMWTNSNWFPIFSVLCGTTIMNRMCVCARLCVCVCARVCAYVCVRVYLHPGAGSEGFEVSRDTVGH